MKTGGGSEAVIWVLSVKGRTDAYSRPDAALLQNKQHTISIPRGLEVMINLIFWLELLQTVAHG